MMIVIRRQKDESDQIKDKNKHVNFVYEERNSHSLAILMRFIPLSRLQINNKCNATKL
jgi:hypothetical protein